MLAWELFDWGVRSFVLLALALVIARVVERRSASLAHCLLVASMGMVLVMPLATLYLPGWGPLSRVASPPATTPTDVAAVPPRVAARDAAIEAPEPWPSPSETHSPETFSPTEQESPIVPLAGAELRARSITPVAATPEPVVADAEVPPRMPRNWRPWVVAAWLAVAGVLFLRIVVGVVRLWHLARGCQPAPASLADEVMTVAGRLGLQRNVTVALAGRDTMPMAFWLSRWTIVLPNNFESWREPLRTTTLVHELGHVARRDAWSDVLVQLVACVAWPLPAAWLVARDIRRLRERACDEWTLEKSGLDVKSYAHTLLEVVDRCQRRSVSFAYAMAGRREFESRLAWILARSRGGLPVPWIGRLAVVGVLSLGMAVATAMTGGQEGRNTPAGDEPAGEVGMEEVVVSAEPAPDEPAISVRGVVVDGAGKPISGAHVVLRPSEYPGGQYAPGLQHDRDLLARTTTNTRGGFEFPQVGIPLRWEDALNSLREGKPGVQLVAWSEGMAIEWQGVTSFNGPDQRLVLHAEAEVVGRITDEQGKPLATGQVRVIGLTNKTGELDGFLREPGDLNLIRSELDFGIRINAGKFVVPHMPKDYRIVLWCKGEMGEHASILVDTAEQGGDRPTTLRMMSFETQRSPLDIKAKQLAWVRIKVLDHEGNPVAGGGIEAIDAERHYGGSVAVDSNGTAVLIVHEPGVHEVYYASDPLSPAPGHVQTIDIRVEETPEVVFRLVEPRWVTGKVVDSETTEPIPGVYVQAGQVESDKPATRPMGSMGVSGRDGKFKVAIADGEWKLSVRHNVDGYFAPSQRATYDAKTKPALAQLRLTPESIPDEITIAIGRGLSISGRVLDSAGNPSADTTVQASNIGSPYRATSTVTDAEGNYLLLGCSPYADTRILTLSDAGAAYDLIPASQDRRPWEETLHKSLDLQLEPGSAVSGRVIKGTKPAADVTVSLLKGFPVSLRAGATQFVKIAEAKTDRDGKYLLRGLRHGDRYHLEIEPVGNAEVRDWRYQSPYSHIMEAKAGETLELPDAVLVSQGQELAGMVVDTKGNPVAGITVSARLVKGTFLSRTDRGPAPWMETDAEGRFHLTHLPDEPISLMAYRANPAGGSIKYPSVVTPEPNATDIRIVIDPRLGQGVENLDE